MTFLENQLTQYQKPSLSLFPNLLNETVVRFSQQNLNVNPTASLAHTRHLIPCLVWRSLRAYSQGWGCARYANASPGPSVKVEMPRFINGSQRMLQKQIFYNYSYFQESRNHRGDKEGEEERNKWPVFLLCHASPVGCPFPEWVDPTWGWTLWRAAAEAQTGTPATYRLRF